jgi:hypothetical protein
MSDFSKIVDHPEKTTIITKLVSAESPKLIAKYLKDKYSKPDEAHLRVPATLLQEFLDTYADHYGYVKKIVSGNADSKLDKKIAESLLDNKAWKERILDSAEKEFNYVDKIHNVLTILETRAEQIFDLIQSDPENTRTDYVFTKYMEMLMLVIEKADKLKNDRPDVRIEHSYTIQMVEQHSVAFQEAIKRVLARLGPEYTTVFMDILNEEMSKMKPEDMVPKPLSIENETKALDGIDDRIKEFDQKFLEDELEQ